MATLQQHHHHHHHQIPQDQHQGQQQQEVVTLNDAISNVDVLDALELPDSQPCITGSFDVESNKIFITKIRLHF